MIVVYYDGKCGLCRKEINHYKNIAKDGVFDWVDVNADNRLYERHGKSLAEALQLLHVEDKNGKLHIAANGFILMWKNLPYYWVLGYIVGLPVIRQIADVCYRIFAKWKFGRLEHCQLSLDDTTDIDKTKK